MSTTKKVPAAEKTYNHEDIVLAKVKGYPAWPGQVLEHDLAPPAVKRQKPNSKNKPVYLVRFFPTGDYAWLPPRDIASLSASQIKSYIAEPSKKDGDLLKGYQIAQDPAAWEKERQDEAAVQAEAAAAAAAEEDDEDQLADDDGAPVSKDTKKRKRKSETGGAKKDAGEEKKIKKAKLEKLAKSRGVGGDASDAKSEAKTEKSKGAAGGEGENDPGLIQVKEWRHKLQKTFLGKGDDFKIPASEMPKCKDIFDTMEKFEMRKDWLAISKLAKVLKGIIKLGADAIPREEEFHFKDRSTVLAQSWAKLSGGDDESSTPVPAVNGSSAGVVEKKEVGSMPAPAPAPAPAAADPSPGPAPAPESAPAHAPAAASAPTPVEPAQEEKKIEAAPAKEEKPVEAEPAAQYVAASADVDIKMAEPTAPSSTAVAGSAPTVPSTSEPAPSAMVVDQEVSKVGYPGHTNGDAAPASESATETILPPTNEGKEVVAAPVV